MVIVVTEKMAVDTCSFDILFSTSVPHILEKVFFSLDYESYKACLEVNDTWKELLTSERYITKGKSVFREEILEDEEKLWNASWDDKTDEARRLLATHMVDVNCRFRKNLAPMHAAAFQGQTFIF